MEVDSAAASVEKRAVCLQWWRGVGENADVEVARSNIADVSERRMMKNGCIVLSEDMPWY